MKNIKNRVKELIKKGYSANEIREKTHLRKQTVLNEIRKIKGTPKRKTTNPHGKKGTPATFLQRDRIIRAYKNGYPVVFIIDVYSKKKANIKDDWAHKISKYEVQKILNQAKKENKSIESYHKENMHLFKKTGRWKQHLDAKAYHELQQHYFENENEQAGFEKDGYGFQRIDIDLAGD